MLPTTVTYLLPIGFAVHGGIPFGVSKGVVLHQHLGRYLIDQFFCHRLPFVNYKDFNLPPVALRDVSPPRQAYKELLWARRSTQCYVQCSTAKIPLMHVNVLPGL